MISRLFFIAVSFCGAYSRQLPQQGPPGAGRAFTRLMLQAMVVAVVTPAMPHAEAAELTLDESVERALDAHPALRRLDALDRAADAEIQIANRRPPMTVGLDAENLLGTGALGGVDGSEFTLSLGALIERGGKRGARTALARTQADRLTLEREAERLDLMAETTRRFIDLLVLQQAREIAGANARAWRELYRQAGEMAGAGAIGRPVVDAQEVEAIRSEIEHEQAGTRLEPARRRLAALWNAEPEPDLTAAGTLMLPSTLPGFPELRARVNQAPQLRALASDARVREARARLTRSSASADLQWSLGARRLEGIDEWALVGSLSLPLGTARRARPEIAQADAERAALEWQRQDAEQRLLATLAEAHGRLREAVEHERRIDGELLPALERAVASTRESWRRGAASYLQLASLQNDLVDWRRKRLGAIRAGLFALIEIERLTGQSLTAFALTAPRREINHED